jgi:hypothetical protein
VKIGHFTIHWCGNLHITCVQAKRNNIHTNNRQPIESKTEIRKRAENYTDVQRFSPHIDDSQ